MSAKAKTSPPEPVRPAYHAGSWYPDDPKKLSGMVNGFLEAAGIAPMDGVVALLAPHAGYVYSGPVAGKAYSAVRGKAFDTVIVAGISHRGLLDGVSVTPKGSYETPLGFVAIDEEIAALLLSDKSGRISHQPGADSRAGAGGFWAEHGLEIQVPFLQTALSVGFQIVPVLVRAGNSDDYAILAGAIAAAVERSGKKVLLVASTDLSHFPCDADAARVDADVMKAAATLDPAKLIAADKRLMSQGVEGLDCTMCGLDAAVPVIMAARKLGGTRAEVLDVRNSHRTAGAEAGRVVGYGAMAVYSGKPDRLTLGTRKGLLALARAAAQSSLEGRKFEPPAAPSAEMKGKGGAFVTLRNGEDLRGCIGNYNLEGSLELWEVVAGMAVSATRDSRFRHDPVTPAEMKSGIKVEISVLSPFTRVEDPSKIELGIHGVSLVWDGERYSVYLPQVAVETGWDLDTFLSQLCAKGGLPPSAWKDRKRMKFDLFTAEVFHE